MTTPDQDLNLPPSSTSRFRCGSPVVFLGLLLSLFLVAGMSARAAEHAFPGEKRERPYALIYGTVWAPDGRPVYGVKVKIRRADQKKAKWELYSDHSGEFAQRVPVGPSDYVVWTDLKGAKFPKGSHLQPGEEVKVHVEADERVDIGLHLK